MAIIYSAMLEVVEGLVKELLANTILLIIFMLFIAMKTIFTCKKKDKFQGLVFRLKKTDYHDSYLHSLNNKLKITGRTDIYKIGKITDLRNAKYIFAM